MMLTRSVATDSHKLSAVLDLPSTHARTPPPPHTHTHTRSLPRGGPSFTVTASIHKVIDKKLNLGVATCAP